MEVTFKHSYNNNLMIIRDNELLINDYKINMIMKNKIEGLLDIYIGCVNGGAELSYVISSKQSVKELFFKEKMKYDDIRILIKGILYLSKELREYLLNINHIILKPEYIFLDINRIEVGYCYYPNNNGNFYEDFNSLLQEIIIITNHNDYKAVELIYGIVEICNRADYLLSDIEKYVDDMEQLTNIGEKQNILQTSINMNLENDETQENIKNTYDMEMPNEETLFSKLVNLLNRKKNSKKEIFKDEKKVNDNSIIEENEYSETVLISDFLKDKERKLFSLCEKEDIVINKYPFIIGKAAGKADEVITDNSVSRMHVRIDLKADEFIIEDLNSKNGTFLNDNRLAPYEKTNITIGDKITIASFDFVFR